MKKILLVEDAPDTTNSTESILKHDRYSITKISNKITAREIAVIGPDVIIIDFLLSFGLGDDLCLEIKNHEPTQHIPVILYSASPHLEKIVGNCKADAFIAKPFDVDHFTSVVHSLVNR